LALLIGGGSSSSGNQGGGGRKKDKYGLVSLVVALFAILGLSNYFQTFM